MQRMQPPRRPPHCCLWPRAGPHVWTMTSVCHVNACKRHANKATNSGDCKTLPRRVSDAAGFFHAPRATDNLVDRQVFILGANSRAAVLWFYQCETVELAVR